MSVLTQPFIGSVSGDVFPYPKMVPWIPQYGLGSYFKNIIENNLKNQYSLFLKDKMAKVTFKKKTLYIVLFLESYHVFHSVQINICKGVRPPKNNEK